MTQNEKEQLLTELLDSEDVAALRESTLSAGLSAVRSRRRRRLATYAAVVVLPWLVLLYPHRRLEIIVPSAKVAGMAKASPKVERINEAQLLALFPNRPLALVGKPGDQQLVFLDQSPPSLP